MALRQAYRHSGKHHNVTAVLTDHLNHGQYTPLPRDVGTRNDLARLPLSMITHRALALYSRRVPPLLQLLNLLVSERHDKSSLSPVVGGLLAPVYVTKSCTSYSVLECCEARLNSALLQGAQALVGGLIRGFAGKGATPPVVTR